MIDITTLQYVHDLIAQNGAPDVVAFNAEPFLDDGYEIGEKEIVLQDHRKPYELTYLAEKLYSGQELYLLRTKRRNFLPSAWLFVIKTDFVKEKQLKFVNGVIHEDEIFSSYLFMYADNIYLSNRKPSQ